MPITIPPFVNYSSPLFPIRSIVGSEPKEGRKSVNVELNWGSILPATAVHIGAGNSPVQFSQIVALAVDNTRNGSDITCYFPDTNFDLVVPSFSQGVFPVFTNALDFYVLSGLPEGGPEIAADTTVIQLLNFLPPPVALQSSQEGTQSGTALVAVNANNTTQIIPNTVSGVLQSLFLYAGVQCTAGTGTVQITLLSTGYSQTFFITLPTGGYLNASLLQLSGLKTRFTSGLQMILGPPSGTMTGFISAAATYQPL